MRPGVDLLEVEGVVQAHHAFDVLHRREARGDRAAHALGGGISRGELRVGLLELPELAFEPVVFPGIARHRARAGERLGADSSSAVDLDHRFRAETIGLEIAIAQ